ncbi:MAG TPA: ASCH domain-containing protein [Polyangiales bacterium]
MLLFQKRFHEGLVSGAVTLTFRRWERARVRVGGRYRCHPIGVLEVDDVRQVRVEEITEADALKAGFGARDELIAYMKSASEEPLRASSAVWRVALHHGGDGDRVELALMDTLSADDVADISARLARMDKSQPWTSETLAIIQRRPRVAASKLAAELGRETLPFKTDVRKLKKLGLTQSFEVGYEISPRGRAYLSRAR